MYEMQGVQKARKCRGSVFRFHMLYPYRSCMVIKHIDWSKSFHNLFRTVEFVAKGIALLLNTLLNLYFGFLNRCPKYTF